MSRPAKTVKVTEATLLFQRMVLATKQRKQGNEQAFRSFQDEQLPVALDALSDSDFAELCQLLRIA